MLAFRYIGLPWWLRWWETWVGKILWRRKWQPTRILSPGKSHGQRSVVPYSLWGGKKSDKWKSETGKGRSHLGGIKQGFCLGVTGTQSCWDPSKKQWETQLRVAPPKGEKPGVIINSRINVFHCLRFTRGVWTSWPFHLSPQWTAKHSFWVENALRQRDAGSHWTIGDDYLHMNSRGVKGTRAGLGCIFPGAFLELLIAMPHSKSLWPWLSFRMVFSPISNIGM